jgi:hypothetical protein
VGFLVLGGLVFGVVGQKSGGTTQSSTVTVTYKLTGSASSADLTYTDASGNIQQQTRKAVPLTTTSGKEGLSFQGRRGAFVSFMAQNNGMSGDLTCTIEADGVPINTGHSSGGYSIVSCSATLP